MDWKKALLMAVMTLSGAIGGWLVGDAFVRICETGPWLSAAGAVVGVIAGPYAGHWLWNELQKLEEENGPI